MQKVEEQRFEFILYINNNIICQRYFNIRGFNQDSVNSFELKELMGDLIGMNNGAFGGLGLIPNHLKDLSKDYTWKYYNPHMEKEKYASNLPTRDLFEKEDNYQFEIRVDRKTVASGEFNGNYFPPKVRYAVDIKDLIPQIIWKIRDAMSRKKYTPSTAPQEV